MQEQVRQPSELSGVPRAAGDGRTVVNAAAIVAKAQEYLGTPFHHQGRLKGKGVDCIGLLVGVAAELGLQYTDYVSYDVRPNPKELVRYLGLACDRVERGWQAGDILVFWFVGPDHPQHAGIAADDSSFIHTYGSIGKVMRHQMTPSWKKHLHSVWRYRWQS